MQCSSEGGATKRQMRFERSQDRVRWSSVESGRSVISRNSAKSSHLTRSSGSSMPNQPIPPHSSSLGMCVVFLLQASRLPISPLMTVVALSPSAAIVHTWLERSMLPSSLSAIFCRHLLRDLGVGGSLLLLDVGRVLR